MVAVAPSFSLAQILYIPFVFTASPCSANTYTSASHRNIIFYYLLNDSSDQPLHFAIVFQSPWRTWTPKTNMPRYNSFVGVQYVIHHSICGICAQTRHTVVWQCVYMETCFSHRCSIKRPHRRPLETFLCLIGTTLRCVSAYMWVCVCVCVCGAFFHQLGPNYYYCYYYFQHFYTQSLDAFVSHMFDAIFLSLPRGFALILK